ncbi:hypothetical protein RCL1_002484 [Eukaryota sp. TZLM3-RCL]
MQTLNEGVYLSLDNVVSSKLPPTTHFSTIALVLEVSVPRSTRGSDCCLILYLIDPTYMSVQNSIMVNTFGKHSNSATAATIKAIAPGAIVVLRSVTSNIRDNTVQIVVNSAACNLISVISATNSSTFSVIAGPQVPKYLTERLEPVVQWSRQFRPLLVSQISDSIMGLFAGRLVTIEENTLYIATNRQFSCPSEIKTFGNFKYKCIPLLVPIDRYYLRHSCLSVGSIVKFRNVSLTESGLFLSFNSNILVSDEVFGQLCDIGSLDKLALESQPDLFVDEIIQLQERKQAPRHLQAFLYCPDFPPDAENVYPCVVRFKVTGVFPRKTERTVFVCSKCSSWSASKTCCGLTSEKSFSRVNMLASCLQTPSTCEVVVLEPLTPELFQNEPSVIDVLAHRGGVMDGLLCGYRNHQFHHKVIVLLKSYSIQNSS